MNTNDIIDDYVVHKFTLEELSVKYGKSVSTNVPGPSAAYYTKISYTKA